MTQRLATDKGKLYIVATPIGNLQDMTFRAIDTLKQVDFILAEDTRQAQKLLTAFNIQTPVRPFHAHNENTLSQNLIQHCLQGKNLALISDAGTPLIQDPGFPLVRLAIEAQIPVIPIPGACALITALSASGVNADTFTFAGFLPVKKAAKESSLKKYQTLGTTLIFYESTHRIHSTIEAIGTLFGDAYTFVLAKELTKQFERFIRGNANTILDFLNADAAHAKGEFVLLLPPVHILNDESEDVHLLMVLLKSLSIKQAVTIATELSKTPKNQLYQLALSITTQS